MSRFRVVICGGGIAAIEDLLKPFLEGAKRLDEGHDGLRWSSGS